MKKLLPLLLIFLLFGCRSKPNIKYHASYLIDDSTGWRVTDSGGRMRVDTVFSDNDTPNRKPVSQWMMGSGNVHRLNFREKGTTTNLLDTTYPSANTRKKTKPNLHYY